MNMQENMRLKRIETRLTKLGLFIGVDLRAQPTPIEIDLKAKVIHMPNPDFPLSTIIEEMKYVGATDGWYTLESNGANLGDIKI